MATGDAASPSNQHELLKQILSAVQSMQEDYRNLSVAVESIQAQISVLSGDKQLHNIAERNHLAKARVAPDQPPTTGDQQAVSDTEPGPNAQAPSLEFDSAGPSEARSDGEPIYWRKHGATATSRIILTTYPGQSGIDPLTMNWGHVNALERGPVVVSRSQSTVRRRNGERGSSLFATVSLTLV